MAKDDDSLDFTKPATERRQVQIRHRPQAPKLGLLAIVLMIAIVGVLAFFWKIQDRDSKEAPPAPQPAVKSAPPPPAAPAPKAAQPYPPPTKLAIPGQAAPQGVKVGALPPEFLKIVRTYNTKAGYKAIALALDDDGKWAYGSISGAAEQRGANNEALAECAKFKLQSAAKSDCKLFAVGDKVVW